MCRYALLGEVIVIAREQADQCGPSIAEADPATLSSSPVAVRVDEV